MPEPVSWSSSSNAPVSLTERTQQVVSIFAETVRQQLCAEEPLSAQELKEFFDTVNAQDDEQKQFVAHLLLEPTAAVVLVKAFRESQRVKPKAARCLFPPAAPKPQPLSLSPAAMLSNFSLTPVPPRQLRKRKAPEPEPEPEPEPAPKPKPLILPAGKYAQMKVLFGRRR